MSVTEHYNITFGIGTVIVYWYHWGSKCCVLYVKLCNGVVL